MSGFGPKRVPGTSQRREVDMVSLAPGVSLYPSTSWRPERRRRGKRGGQARPELPKSRGSGAQGTLRARAEDRKPGDNPFPSACSRGTSSPGNPPSRSQPGEQRVWEARSGSEKRASPPPPGTKARKLRSRLCLGAGGTARQQRPLQVSGVPRLLRWNLLILHPSSSCGWRLVVPAPPFGSSVPTAKGPDGYEPRSLSLTAAIFWTLGLTTFRTSPVDALLWIPTSHTDSNSLQCKRKPKSRAGAAVPRLRPTHDPGAAELSAEERAPGLEGGLLALGIQIIHTVGTSLPLGTEPGLRPAEWEADCPRGGCWRRRSGVHALGSCGQGSPRQVPPAKAIFLVERETDLHFGLQGKTLARRERVWDPGTRCSPDCQVLPGLLTRVLRVTTGHVLQANPIQSFFAVIRGQRITFGCWHSLKERLLGRWIYRKGRDLRWLDCARA
ncbi:hypothetical protein NN561_015375 [Cricetulus griseus]